MTKFVLVLSFLFASSLLGAGAGGVNLTAEEAFKIGSLPVTNSMITSWIISIIILVIRLLVGKTFGSERGTFRGIDCRWASECCRANRWS